MFASLDSSYKAEECTGLAPPRNGECVLLRLPLEVLLHALGFLDPLDLCTAARTCTALAVASKSNCLWRRFCDPEWFASGTEPCKARYLAWIRPRVRDYARQRSELRGEPTPGKSYGPLAPDEPHNMKIVRRQQPQQDPQERTMKLVVVGHAEFERTRLIRRWAGQGPGQTSRRATTIGVDFALKVLDVNGTVVRVQTWDIANQERFGNMVRVYLKEACGAALVYDVTKRESFDRLPEWVDHVLKANIPSVIPAEEWQVTSEEAASFAAQIGALGSITVSSRDDIRVDEAFMMLVNNILEESHDGSENMLYTTVFGPVHLRRCWVPAKAVLDEMPLTVRTTTPAAANSSKCLMQ